MFTSDLGMLPISGTLELLLIKKASTIIEYKSIAIEWY